MSLGEQLRSAREAKGLAIGDVARTTYIRTHYLEAIERDDFSAIPPSRLQYFVQDYARSVGLDPAMLLKDLPEVIPPAPAAPQPPPSRSLPSIPAIGKAKESKKEPKKVQSFEDDETGGEAPASVLVPSAPDHREPRRKRPRYAPLDQGNPALVRGLMTVALLLLVGLGIYFLAGGFDKPSVEDSNGTASVADTSSEGEVRILSRSEGTAESSGDSVNAGGEAVESGDSLTLQGRATASVWWYSVKMDNRQETGTMDSGQIKVWKAEKQFSVSLGNAGGVEFTLNGKPIGTLGRLGYVVRRKIITAQGVQQSGVSKPRSTSSNSPARSSRKGNTSTATPPENRLRTLESTEPRRAVNPD